MGIAGSNPAPRTIPLKPMPRSFLLLLFVLVASVQAQAAVDFPWVKVGDPGNPPDPLTGFGRVDYSYEISAYDVTNEQYVEFLNAVDPAGMNTLGLWNQAMSTETGGGIDFNPFAPQGSKFAVKPGRVKKPFTFGTFFNALRFINWLNNGQGNADTETGAYTLLGGTPVPANGATVTRDADAKIFLTSENEWYKAAYYQGNGTYTLYATGSTAPTPSAPTSAPNCANYNNAVGDFTDVGAYTGSPSHYGTFDQAGNIWNWNESIIPPNFDRGLRGDAYVHEAALLASTYRYNREPFLGGLHVGFRVARVPRGFGGMWEMGLSAATALIAGGAYWWWRYKKRA